MFSSVKIIRESGINMPERLCVCVCMCGIEKWANFVGKV